MNEQQRKALKLALEAFNDLAAWNDGEVGSHMDEPYAAEVARITITAIKEALAQPEQEPVGKLQEPTAERAWFTIAELNAWADKKLSENPHWVMPKDEPERDEAPLQRKPLFIGKESAEFAEWFNAVWLGDGEQGETIPTSGKEYDDYLNQYTLAFGAWMAAKEAAYNIKENT